MFASSRRWALPLLLLALPAAAAPHREAVRAARIRGPSARTDTGEVAPSEAAPLAAAAAEAGGVDLAGLLGMLTALAVTWVYARAQRQRLAPVRRSSLPAPGAPPRQGP